MAGTKRTTVRTTTSERARPRRTTQRAVRTPQKSNSKGRLIHHDDAAALWRGLCASCRTSLQRISQNVAQLFRDAGKSIERLRERAALPEPLRAPSGDDGRTTTSKPRGEGAKRPKRNAAATSQRKTRANATKKKTAAAKQTTKRASSKKVSRSGSQANTPSSRSTPRTTRRAAKSRRPTTRGKQRTGRKK